MKNKTFFSSALAFALILVGSDVNAQQPVSDIPLVSVSGEAEIRVAPDIVIITLGVESRSTKLDDAVAAHSERIKKLIDYVKSQEIEDKHIQTDYISIRPAYDHRSSHTTPSHYEVNKSVTIRVTEVDKFEALLAGVLKSGASHVRGIQFLTSELRKHRDAARNNAIKAAKEKAEALAAELGQKVGRVHAITETSWGGGMHSMRGSMMTQNSIQSVSGGAAGEGFAAGQIAILLS